MYPTQMRILCLLGLAIVPIALLLMVPPFAQPLWYFILHMIQRRRPVLIVSAPSPAAGERGLITGLFGDEDFR